MKTLYLECFSGMSGNMFLAAMLELGVELDYLKRELSRLHVDDEFGLEVSTMDKNGIAATYVDVILKKENMAASDQHGHEVGCCGHMHEDNGGHHHEHGHDHHHDHHHEEEGHSHEHGHAHEHSHDHDHEHCHGEDGHSHEHWHAHEHSHDHHHDHCHGEDGHSHEHGHMHRNLEDIHHIIEKSELPPRVQELAKRIFGFVARAESRIHGKPVSEVHFHEVGAIDSIVDIVGAAICVDYLGIEKMAASPVAVGTGFVRCAHGLMPLPAPATLEILREAGIPYYQTEIKGELLTPTGAAILAALVSEYGPMPAGRLSAAGYGAGRRNQVIPNVVRACLMEEAAGTAGLESEVLELRFQVDDMTGEELGFFMELALAEGAKDIYYQPIFMKKNRPATAVTILLSPADLDHFSELIFKHTSTLGFRHMLCPRREMERQNLESSLNGETYQVKIAQWENTQKISYEYEDIKRIALKQNKTLQEILNEISFSVFESIRRQKENQAGSDEQE